MFFADIDAVLSGVLALLRPGGSFAAATWGNPAEVPLLSLPMMLLSVPGGSPPDLTSGPFALHDPANLAQRLRVAGFADVVVEPFELDYKFASPREYFDHVSEMAPPVSAHVQRLDDDGRAAFRQEVEKRVAERFAFPDGTIRIPNRVLIASATRPV
jgi:hypothetical protein